MHSHCARADDVTHSISTTLDPLKSPVSPPGHAWPLVNTPEHQAHQVQAHQHNWS